MVDHKLGIGLLIFVAVTSVMPIGEQNIVNKGFAMAYLKKYQYMGSDSPDSIIAAMSDDEGYKVGLLSFQRRNHLNDTGILDNATATLMAMPRCGMADVTNKEDTFMNMEETPTRKRRFTWDGVRKMNKYSLTYKITQYTPDLSRQDVDLEIRRAFGVWEMVTDLRFTQVPDDQNADITILFGPGNHGDNYPFDGSGGVLAHAFYPQNGNAHFDEAETWTIGSFSGTNLLFVAVHEFGHSMGLGHSEISTAIMAPYYTGYIPEFMLHQDDVLGIQAIYGPPSSPTTKTPTTSYRTTARPTMTSDTTEPTTSTPTTTSPATITSTTMASTSTTEEINIDLYNLCNYGSFDTMTQHEHKDGSVRTYVFRNNFYAEISDGQIVPGYPKKISEGWNGLPDDIDAAIYWSATYNTYFVWNNGWQTVKKLTSPARTYFFKGSQYWRVRNGQVESGYPKSISSGWGLPNDLDAAFVWKRNGKSYFFKDNTYYRYTRDRGLDGGYPRHIKVWSDAFVDGVDTVTDINGESVFTRGAKHWAYNNALTKVKNGYPKDSRKDILGCQALELSSDDQDDPDYISGAPCLSSLPPLLASCIVVLLTSLALS